MPGAPSAIGRGGDASRNQGPILHPVARPSTQPFGEQLAPYPSDLQQNRGFYGQTSGPRAPGGQPTSR